VKYHTVAIRDVAKLVNGKAYNQDDWNTYGLPIIRIQNLNNDNGKFNFWSGETDNQVVVENGHLLFAWSGTPGTSFGAHIWNGDKAVLNQHIFRVDLDETRALKSWARFSLNMMIDELISQAHGGVGLKHVTKGMIDSLSIPLPPLPEQRRIAAILDKAEALRAKRRAALAKLDQLAQSIFLEMFGDPVSNPKCWPLNKFLNIGKLDRGVSKYRPRNAPELLNGPYPLVQTGDVANSGGYIREYKQTYSEIGLKQSRIWPSGTLCITIAANIAKTGILTFDACFPDSVVGFTPNDLCNSEFVRTWLSFLQKMLEDSAPESAQKNINLEILRNLDIPLPPIPLQQAFAHRIEAIESLKASHRASLAKLDALFASLQDRAFRGEL